MSPFPASPGDTPSPKDLLSIPEAVQFAGLSASTLWRYIQRGRLPKVQHGGPRARVLLRRTDLLAVTADNLPSPEVPDAAVGTTTAPKLSGRLPAWKRRDSTT
jgi:predicted DNA-binding transcriptional regulator AlpA